MKVKEVIKLEGWIDGSGRSWQDTYAENTIEIKESELPKTANDYDWSWYDLPAEDPEDSGEDTKIIVEFYAEDAEPGYDEPLAKISKWESDLRKERNA
jgi:predicted nucleotidyltransferase